MAILEQLLHLLLHLHSDQPWVIRAEALQQRVPALHLLVDIEHERGREGLFALNAVVEDLQLHVEELAVDGVLAREVEEDLRRGEGDGGQPGLDDGDGGELPADREDPALGPEEGLDDAVTELLVEKDVLRLAENRLLGLDINRGLLLPIALPAPVIPPAFIIPLIGRSRLGRIQCAHSRD